MASVPRWRRRVVALAIVAVVGALVSSCSSGGDATDDSTPAVQLIESGKVCGMASRASVARVLETDRFRLGRDAERRSTGLEPLRSKQRPVGASCLLATKPVDDIRLVINVSLVKTQGYVSAGNVADLQYDVRKAAPSEGCTFEPAGRYRAAKRCNGTDGIDVTMVRPGLSVEARLYVDERQAQARVDDVTALTGEVQRTVAALDTSSPSGSTS